MLLAHGENVDNLGDRGRCLARRDLEHRGRGQHLKAGGLVQIVAPLPALGRRPRDRHPPLILGQVELRIAVDEDHHVRVMIEPAALEDHNRRGVVEVVEDPIRDGGRR